MLDRVIEGNAVDEVRALPDCSVHLTLFSPPYDGIRDYDGRPALDLEALAAALFRVTVEGGFCAMVLGQSSRAHEETFTAFEAALAFKRCGWRPFQTLIYSRAGRPGAWFSRRFRVDHEYIFTFFKGARPRIERPSRPELRIPAKHAGRTWAGTERKTSGETASIAKVTQAATKCRGSVWPYATSNTERNALKMQHPATMPAKMARDLILAFSNPGDCVFDPTCGSGETVIQALNLERDGFGCDISPRYCAIARERIMLEVRPPFPRCKCTIVFP